MQSLINKIISTEIYRKIKNSFYYFGSSIIGILISLVTFPIYSYYLNAEDFGLIGYFASVSAFLTPVFNLGTSNYYLMQYYRQSEIENKKLLYNIIFYLTLSNLFFSAVSILIIYFYFKIFDVIFPFEPFIYFAVLSVLFEPYKSFLLLQYRVRQDGLKFFLISILSPILNALFCVILLSFGFGAEGRLGGIAISGLLIGLFSAYILLNKYAFVDYSYNKFKVMIRTIYPLVISSYAFIPINSLDRLLLERLNAPAELGLYSIGVQISGFFYAAAFALFTAFEPEVYKSVIEKSKTFFRLNLKRFLWILTLGFIVFMFLQPFIISVLTNNKFNGAMKYSLWLTIGNLISAGGLILNAVILAKQQIKYSSYVVYVSAFSTIALFPLFIWYFGFDGAIVGKLLVPIIAISFSLFVVKKLGFD